MCLSETYSRVHTSKNMAHKFLIQNGLKQGDALSPLLFIFTLEYVIMRVQEKQEGWVAPKPKEKVRNLKNSAPWGPEWGMENVVFFSILAPVGKGRNIVYKEAL
jgi:hypothetical protein